ncbi:Gfo/Idh/MocA family protein [Paenibacillus radicis (ex Xue et al. 2023)]|uniref:Gfo/Idh/MocA family oxidoreductase n=1 Tax=Paenibacillus radicis (ex Xue et al. 2023) TaxID=2972489 RepID=A0ABT1YKV9_9BACL|nr:Gfo/Idh/MocA family oxidoreductase [Paenibacillus radicis (ex Xue et al. 2023)]MCR8633044.1 Gfo/Idh/MocA family oxidoreductase [Paenibacillus radicis (ex Xue et al. 2023)]
MNKLNVALVGYNFMGKVHSHAMDNVSFFFKSELQPVKKVIVGRTEHLVKQAAENFGWESYETDWRKAIHREDIDAVLICSSTNTHMEIAIEAAAAGKHILCEKPLALTAVEAKKMLDAAEAAGVVHMLGHNYRRVPAICLAKKLIDDGKLGELYHFRGVYLQDWLLDPQFPTSWKLDKNIAGSGPHGDLNAHLIDLARYLVGEVDQVVGMEKTFITKRPKVKVDATLGADFSKVKGDVAEMVEVTVDDTTSFLAKFKNGTMGTFEATRMAGGRKNYEQIEINGTKGSLVFNFEQMNELQYWSKEDDVEVQGFRKILATEDVHPYVHAWWPPGHIIGYQNTFVNQLADFIDAIRQNKAASPNFYDGWLNNQVLDAVSRSTKSLTWEKPDHE